MKVVTLQDLLNTSGREREELLEKFTSANSNAYRRVAKNLCIRNNIHMDLYLDDMTQVVHMCALKILRDIFENPEKADAIRSWVGWVESHCRNDAAAFQAKTQGAAHLSGMTSKYRRVKRAHATANQLRKELGREPSATEIIERANAGIRDRVKSSNMILTSDDLEFASTAPVELNDEITPSPHEDEIPLAFVLGKDPSTLISDTINELPTYLEREVISAWLKPLTTGGGNYPLTSRELSRLFRIPEAHVEEIIRYYRALMIAYLARESGDSETLRSYANLHGLDTLT